jgi:ABC-type transporter Mla subunit MlaD
MRRIAMTLLLLMVAGAAAIVTRAGADGSHTYNVELDNAFGLVNGSEVRIAGVTAGTITDLNIDAQKRAVVTINVSGPLATFRKSATCSSQPQSLIAEYFLDCQPGTKGPKLPENGLIPVHSKQYGNQTSITVQPDLVQNTLREPFKERFSLIINEFGTALAGNPTRLNAAIRRGAPSLTALRQALQILARQNTTIRDLNVNSDKIISKLAQRKGDVISFIRNANRAATASAERRTDLAANFRLLPGFLAELRPTLAKLGNLADQQTPLLVNLDAASGQLNRLTSTLPRFNYASVPAVRSLGAASVIGTHALRRGKDEITALRQATRKSYPAADQIANLLVDIGNPARAVETDARAARDTGRPAPTGYTGLEGLLNYAYYQTLAINQFDTIGHLLHFIIYEFQAGPCGKYNAGSTVPAKGGGQTTSPSNKASCVAWLGNDQPQINTPFAAPPYHPSVCPNGSDAPNLCPDNSARLSSRQAAGPAVAQSSGASSAPPPGTQLSPTAPQLPSLPSVPSVPSAPQSAPNIDPNSLGGLLGVTGASGQQLTPAQQRQLKNMLSQGGNGAQASGDLLNFLFGN